MSVVAFLTTELQSLISETRRKYPEIRQAAENSLGILRASPDQASAFIAQDGPQSDELLQPIFMGCSTKNAKVVLISLGSLQRLIAMKAVPLSTVPRIVSTMAECMSQGVDVQLRILQTLLALLTNFPQVHGSLLGDALLLCFKLQDSRIAVVSSTAAATLRQLVMFVYDKVVDLVNNQDTDPQRGSFSGEETELPDGSRVALHPSARDAYCVFEDLCLLANMEPPQFLKLESLPKTFSLELIESVLSNYHALFRKRSELLLLLRHHLCPMLHKSLSDRPLFPLTLRSIRVVFLLLKQFSAELETEAEVFLTLLIKVVSGELDSQEPSSRPHWMRVLAMEIIRGLCNDSLLIRSIWDRYDAKKDGSNVFSSLINALKRLANEKPSLLGVEAQMFGLGVHQSPLDGSGGAGYGLDVATVTGLVTSAAGMVGIGGAGSSLSVASASMKLQCIDQLDKADSPVIPEPYIYLLALQSITTLADGFASQVLPLYTSIVVQQRPRTAGDAVIRAPAALDLSTLPASEPGAAQLRSIHDMVDDAWPAMLAALSFFISTSLSDDLFVQVLSAMQNMANVAGVLGLTTPRDAFITSISKFAIPAGVVSGLASYVEPATPRTAGVLSAENLGLSALAGGSSAQSPTLSERNIACLKVIMSIAAFLAGSLDASWFNILETLQNADYVLVVKGSTTSSAVSKRSSMGPGPSTLGPKGRVASSTSLGLGGSGLMISSSSANAEARDRHPMLSALDLESVQMSMSRLFEASKNLDDGAFGYFVKALCRLSAEMVNMQSNGEVYGVRPDESSEELSAMLSPRPDSMHRRRASGIHLTKSTRGGDYGVTKLGVVSSLNIHRLVYRDSDVAWNPIVNHLLSVLRNSRAPSPIRLQAAEVLDDILVLVPRNISSSSSSDLQRDTQQRVLSALSTQVFVEVETSYSSTVTDVRRLGLETLHKILQSSGHTLVVGWELIFDMLSSVCTPVPGSIPEEPSPTPSSLSSPTKMQSPIKNRPPPLWSSSATKSNAVLIRIAFQSLTLVCDSVELLSPPHLRLCISTLGQFGHQPETNMALTAAESLFWGVSDSIQSKRKDMEKEPIYSELWMFLLLELLGLSTDSRPEVRNGAIQTLFRSLQLYGATLSSDTWTACLDRVIFPLLNSITTSISQPEVVASQPASASYAAYDPSPSAARGWDETKSLAFQQIGQVFSDFLIPKILRLSTLPTIWDQLIGHVKHASRQDHRSVTTAALKCLDKSLLASKAAKGDLHPIAMQCCNTAWVGMVEVGSFVSQTTAAVVESRPFTQECLHAYVDVVSTIYFLTGESWDLSRTRDLLAILKDVMTYSRSPEYRPDIDGLTPVQAAVTTVIEGINLKVPGSSSLVLSDLSEFVTLAFVASFSVGDVTPSVTESQRPRSMHVTYIGLTKYAMPKLVQLFLSFKNELGIFNDGTVEQILSAYSIPIKLKYDCPAPSKFGSDDPLWKTATINFLQIVREIAPSLSQFEQNIPVVRVESVWRQVLEVFRGGLLADCSVADQFSLAEQAAEERFDLALLATLEVDVVPYLGDARVPDTVIVQLSRTLQNASILYDRGDTNRTPTNGSVDGAETIFGTTAPSQMLPREQFSYWCFDLLFLICSASSGEQGQARRRVASLAIPSLLGRCHAALAGYVVDVELRGGVPFPRVREEELLYVLHKLRDLKLYPGSLWAALSENPSLYCAEQPAIDPTQTATRLIADATRRSPHAHLFHFYTLLYEIATVTVIPPSAAMRIPAPGTVPTEPGKDGPKSTISALAAADTDGDTSNVQEVDARQLAKDCLRLIGKEMGAEI